ncbi:lipid asymmetry maintenance protein MlaB [Marinobacter sp.]|uniref:STAS domain-containing protein n=1 Tax=Marinobacter sp. TaxID=50741 RepID=UPI00384B427F
MTDGAGAPGVAPDEDGRLVVTGEVTADSAVGLRADGERLIRSRNVRDSAPAGKAGTEIGIDLQGVVTASSIVLSLLMCWQRLAVSEGLHVRYSGISDRLHSLASLSGLDRQLSGF